jgi:hypothetical protein
MAGEKVADFILENFDELKALLYCEKNTVYQGNIERYDIAKSDFFIDINPDKSLNGEKCYMRFTGKVKSSAASKVKWLTTGEGSEGLLFISEYGLIKEGTYFPYTFFATFYRTFRFDGESEPVQTPQQREDDVDPESTSASDKPATDLEPAAPGNKPETKPESKPAVPPPATKPDAKPAPEVNSDESKPESKPASEESPSPSP